MAELNQSGQEHVRPGDLSYPEPEQANYSPDPRIARTLAKIATSDERPLRRGGCQSSRYQSGGIEEQWYRLALIPQSKPLPDDNLNSYNEEASAEAEPMDALALCIAQHCAQNPQQSIMFNPDNKAFVPNAELHLDDDIDMTIMSNITDPTYAGDGSVMNAVRDQFELSMKQKSQYKSPTNGLALINEGAASDAHSISGTSDEDDMLSVGFLSLSRETVDRCENNAKRSKDKERSKLKKTNSIRLFKSLSGSKIKRSSGSNAVDTEDVSEVMPASTKSKSKSKVLYGKSRRAMSDV